MRVVREAYFPETAQTYNSHLVKRWTLIPDGKKSGQIPSNTI